MNGRPSDRRTFLKKTTQLTAGTALFGPALLDAEDRLHATGRPKNRRAGGLFASTLPESGLPTDAELMQRALDLLAKAERDMPYMFDQSGLLAKRWDEASALWSAAVQRLSHDGYRLLVPSIDDNGSPTELELDYERPWVSLPDFLENERLLLEEYYGSPQALTDQGQIVSSAAWRAGPADADGFDAGTVKVMAKILGLGEVVSGLAAILELLQQHGALAVLQDALASRAVDALEVAVRLIIDLFKSRPFQAELAEKIGASAASRLLAKLLGRIVPFVGWAVFIGSIVWAAGAQVCWVNHLPGGHD